MPKVPSAWDAVPSSTNIEDRRWDWDPSRGSTASISDAASRGKYKFYDMLYPNIDLNRMNKPLGQVDPKFLAMAQAVQFQDQRTYEQQQLQKLPSYQKDSTFPDISEEEYIAARSKIAPGGNFDYLPKDGPLDEALDKHPDGLILYRKHLPEKLPSGAEVFEIPWAKDLDKRLFIRRLPAPTS